MIVLNVLACFAAAYCIAVVSHRQDPHVGGWRNAEWWERLALEALGCVMAVCGFVSLLLRPAVSDREVFVNLAVATVSVTALAAMRRKGALLDQSSGHRRA